MKAYAIVDRLLEAEPDAPDKDYALHLARRISQHALMSELRAAGIHSPQCWSWAGPALGEPSMTISGMFFGHDGEGAKHAVEKVFAKNGLHPHYWRAEPYAEPGTEIPYSSGEKWWKFTTDVPLMHFMS